MATANPPGIKCTAEECGQVIERIRVLYPMLSDHDATAERARIFHALGNEKRLQILALLSVRQLCVCNLVAALGGAASTVAHHLRILEEAGLIMARQEGKFTLYPLDEAILRQYRVFDESLSQEPVR